MKTALVVFQVVIGLISVWPHKKAPRPVVVVTDTMDADGSPDIAISVTCAKPYVVHYDVTELPVTTAQRISVANAATCIKAPKAR